MAMINLKLPDDLRNKYKAFCALNRPTMQSDPVQFIEKRVAKKEGKQ